MSDISGSTTSQSSMSGGIKRALDDVKTASQEATRIANENVGNTDDPLANLNTLQAQLKLTQALNFATNLMMTVHQQCMAAINKLGEAGR